MDELHKRRSFIKHAFAAAVSYAIVNRPTVLNAANPTMRLGGTKLKIALNAFSFNSALMAGKMTLNDVVDYCAKHNIDGVDVTGYYFPGYPEVPNDEAIFRLRKRAYINGVTINGTGVRNDFTLPDADARKKQVKLVKNWIDVAAKLGANVVRVFSGLGVPNGHTFEEVMAWMVPEFRECAEYAGQRGIIVGLQHHDDFLKTADETIRVVRAVDSDWFSVILDVGSLRQGDPYEEIEKLLPYACTWQVKENVYFNQKATPIDLQRLKALIDKVGFRGFLPIEALGTGDPAIVVTGFLEKVRKAMF